MEVKQMFEKLQMEVMKKAAKLDGSGSPVSRPAGKFPYMYGYTDDSEDSGDLVIFTAYYACVIPRHFVYINAKSVFRDMTPATTNGIKQIINDEKTKPATLTSELRTTTSVHTTKASEVITNVFEVDGGERVYVDTKLLKPFNDLKIPLTFRGSGYKSPIFVYDDSGRKLGLVLPTLIK